MKRINISPALNAQEIDFLTKFSETRRMLRKKGPHFVGTGWRFCQETEDDVINYNKPGEGQPSLWCNWKPTADGTALVWKYEEGIGKAAAWKRYLVEHFLQGHTCS